MMRGQQVVFVVLLAAVAVGYGPFASEAVAAGPWYVNAATGSDAFDCLNPSVGGGGQGPCQTLAGAYAKASADDIVNVAAGIYPVSLTIDKDVIIVGAGATATVFDGGGTNRVFHVLPGVNLSLRGAAISNGFGSPGGGVRNEGLTSLRGMALTANSHRAVFNAANGRVNIEDSAFTANPNGAVQNNGTIAIVGSFFARNTSTRGGGIYNENGSATLVSVVVRDNTSTIDGGGGIHNFGADAQMAMLAVTVERNVAPSGGGIATSGALTVFRSTISGNHAGGNGGGGGIIASSGTAFLTLISSTVSGNQTGGNGGGLRVSGGANISFSTIAGNTADGSAGGLRRETGVVTVKGSILGDNSGSDCSGTVVSADYNVIENQGSCSFTAANDVVGSDALLRPLRDNGGSGYLFVTETHGLLPGSPAVSRVGPSGDCTVLGTGQATGSDQRWRARPQTADVLACDAGAYELDRVGGKGFRISTAGPSVVTSWTRGFAEQQYFLHRFGVYLGSSVNLGPFAAAMPMPHADLPPDSDLHCFVALPYDTTVLAVSDVLCAYRGVAGGTVMPADFGLQLNQLSIATLTWREPTGGVDRYALTEIKLFENTSSTTLLPDGVTQHRVPLTVSGPTCFVLTAFKGSASGTTDVLCGVPGIGSTATTAAPATGGVR